MEIGRITEAKMERQRVTERERGEQRRDDKKAEIGVVRGRCKYLIFTAS